MLKAMKVVHRILLIAVVALIGMIAIAVSGDLNLRNAINALNDVYENRIVPLRDIKAVSDLYAVGIVSLAQKANARSIDFNTAKRQIEEAENAIASNWEAYLKTEMTPDEQIQVDEINALRAASTDQLKQLKSLLASGDADGLNDFTRTVLYPTIDPLTSKFSALIQIQLDATKAIFEDSLREKARSERISIMVILLAAILCIALALLIARQINGELGGEPSEAAHQVTLIATGHLATHIDIRPGFEHSMLGAVEKMRSSLNDIISEIRTCASQLESVSVTMSDNGSKALEAVNAQNESTAAIAAAVEQMSVNISHVTDSAMDASRNSEESSEAVEHGIEVVQQSVQGMNGIMKITETTGASIKQLAEKSSEIGKIINVIKDIADQTNLLALNAAIEAARAGEAGRGFAVVADEVRQLAERTAQSTSEIVSMVQSIQTGTNNTLTNTAASQEHVTEGVRLANNTGISMHEVKNKIDETLSSVKTISEALSEQSVASQQIGRDVENIAQMTDENAASVNKLNDTAAQVKDLAADLNKLVRHFQV